LPKLPNTKVTLFDTSADLLAAVESGKIEGAILSSLSAFSQLKDNAHPALKVEDTYLPALALSELVFTVAKGNAALLGKLNASLQKFATDDTTRKLAVKWGVTPNKSTASVPCMCLGAP
jgi:polar amino acid transport system substrate-binding protein